MSQPPTPRTSDAPIGVDDALAIAHSALPGARAFSIGVPGRSGGFAVRIRFPEDLTPGGRSMVTIDPSGKILRIQSSRTAPAGVRLVNLNRAIHTGDIFGLPSKFVMSLASLALAVQAVAGVMMWLKRRTSRASAPEPVEASRELQQS